MSSNFDIDFKQITARGGSQSHAFEELCCQIGYRTVPKDVSYTRLHGAGGDGGVECYADLPDCTRMGWQAKYVFSIDSLIRQTDNSLSTALKIHPTLTTYIVCFPFDLTGPTGRKGQSGQEKFDKWREKRRHEAEMDGLQLTIEAWSASKLRGLLLEHDASGGIREFFFNHQILTDEWFSQHMNYIKETAGPRYTPELNVQTELWKWFAAFGRTHEWIQEFENMIRTSRKTYNKLDSSIKRTKSDEISSTWPEELRPKAQSLITDIAAILDECNSLVVVTDYSSYENCVDRFGNLLRRLRSLQLELVDDFDKQHGSGKADSPGFRQFMAEYMVSFPAANLDDTREAIATFIDFHDWLRSPACSLAYEHVFVLSGDAGSGKTHGACDVATQRFGDGLLTCLTFGHLFGGEPDLWTRLCENFGLPITLGMNGLLDTLNTAGEASGSPLILCIEAINETRPLRYWRDRLSTVSQAVQTRAHLRLVITCRTQFKSNCLPEANQYQIVEHQGFSGVERVACQTFFHYYKLEPPISPILQPELSNPLYLRLVCETLQSRGLHRLPTGWHGLLPTIHAFLQEKERQFAEEHETIEGANLVKGSLMAIASEIANAGDTVISWSQAQRVISVRNPQTNNMQVLEWLIRANLLIEDAPLSDSHLKDESIVRPAFERLGDFLLAYELLETCKQTGFEIECKDDGLLNKLWKNTDALGRNSGVIGALSIILPEQNLGLELPNLIENDQIYNSIVQITISSFPSRDPATFSQASKLLILKALRLNYFSYNAMDAALAISWQPSEIDAIWLDQLLKQKPLAERDAYWCGYLHDRFDSHGAVERLINGAFELPLDRLEQEIAERWTTVLFWVTAAADRRVKDKATRAAIAILAHKSKIIPNVLRRLIVSDDDEVRERTLLSCYGALIISQDTEVIGLITEFLQDTYRSNPRAFDNALIRDHIRCISELAQVLNCLPSGSDPELSMKPITSDWPLKLPSEEQTEEWGELLNFKPDEMSSDFFKYSMECLRSWYHGFSKKDMGQWILLRAARDFRYENSGCKEYDDYMLGKYGGGRSKPAWAERIAKKYLWVAMYQLASRLHDQFDRKQETWEPEPLRVPLILSKERSIDPTLPSNIIETGRDADAWWTNSSVDLNSSQGLSDEEWVASEANIPEFRELLSIVRHDGQDWYLLVSYPTWDDRCEEADWAGPYRHMRITIDSYLILKQDITNAYNYLHRRNLFGGWMPEGAIWLYGFAGEYPWGTPFNTEPEEWHQRGGYGDDIPVKFEPCWNQLAVEWEYDSSVPRNFHMNVPARKFFSLGDLWWDGRDGYRTTKGRTVFRDPSVTEEGPASLITDADDLLKRLDKLEMCLIWTLLGKKQIVGHHHDRVNPRRLFSQIASLDKDGSLRVGDRVYFDE